MVERGSRAAIHELDSIRAGDFVEVEWIDAATVKDASIDRLPLPNDYVETTRRTIGIFVCIQKGATWRVPILALLMDQIDHGSVIRTIPIPIIMQVKTKANKTPETVQKAEQAFQKIRQSLRRERDHRNCKDGATKFLE